MKKIILASLMMMTLPFMGMAQSAGDDLYFIPKKKVVKKEVVVSTPKKIVKKETTSTGMYATPGSNVVVRDVRGKKRDLRDIDEYNRRYTSRDYTFTQDDEDETLYIDEKPYDERGEWVNGFEGSQSDYEYAMRIVRFRNPRFAIPVSSPLYWDIVYALPSWEWNVFSDGFYAYAFPTYSNPYWWDWRFDFGPTWGSYWGYRPYGFSFTWSTGYWYGAHWGGYHWGCNPWHGHYHPYYGWSGGYWGGGYWGGGYWGGGSYYGSSKLRPGIHAGRYDSQTRRGGYLSSSNTRGSSSGRYVSGRTRNSRDAYLNRGTDVRNSSRNAYVRGSNGRVVRGADGQTSVRPNRRAIRSVNQNDLVGSTVRRSSNGTTSRGNSYTRPIRSKDRNVNSSVSTSRRKAERGSYRSSTGTSRDRSTTYQRSSRSKSSSSYSSGSGSGRSRSSFSQSSGSRSSRSSGVSRSGGGSRGGSRGHRR